MEMEATYGKLLEFTTTEKKKKKQPPQYIQQIHFLYNANQNLSHSSAQQAHTPCTTSFKDNCNIVSYSEVYSGEDNIQLKHALNSLSYNYLRNKTSLIRLRSLRLNSYFPSQQKFNDNGSTRCRRCRVCVCATATTTGSVVPANVFSFYSHRCAQILHCTPKLMPAANIVIPYCTQRHSEQLSERWQKHVIIRLKQIFQKLFPGKRTYIPRRFVVKNHLNGWSAWRF